ncbi:MAG: flavodoxin family protein [Candidatus Latescibacteria bacterium]|nr:flavodoxin family protein [Candidatus Latescibacterota bacterium]
MKIAIVYHSVSGNTKKQADLVAEGARSIDGAEVKTMSIDSPDNAWIEDSAAVIFGSPCYEGSCSWQMKKYFDTPKVDFSGKLAGFFSSQNWPGGGGADFAEMTMIAAALVLGMLAYSGGVSTGYPPIHFGAVSHKAPTTDIDRERAVKLGKNIAAMAQKLFG